MRVTQGMLYQTSTNSLSQAMTNMAKVAEQVSSTKRLNHPSDDPADVRTAVKVRDAMSELDQFVRNIDSAQRWVSAADAALGNAGDVVQRANELALEAANGTLGAADRGAIAKEVEQLTGALVQDASAKAGDQYIFSGFRVDRPPYAETAPGTVGPYQGDQGVLLTRIGPDATIGVNLAGDKVFQPAVDALMQLHADLVSGQPVQQTTLTQLQSGLQAIIDARADAGARGNRLDQTKAAQDVLTEDSQKLLSELEDADMAQAISDLSQRQLTYDASLKVNARVMQNSLIDYLR